MPPEASDPAQLQRPILLVEDNPVDLDLALRAFRKRHLSNPVEVARDGSEVLDRLATWERDPQALPIVILLDLKLPKVSGLEVLRALRAHPVAARLPVVVLTSSGENPDIEQAYALGANSYIVKPVDFDKFHEVATQIELYWCVLNRAPEAAR
jgi:CheY-like chemotaxis protein